MPQIFEVPTPSPTPTPFIVVNQCITDKVGGDDSEWQIAVAFTNNYATDSSAVEFRFDFLDAFGGLQQSENGTVYGRFSPGVLIQPTRSPVAGLVANALTYLNEPGNAAWEFYISNPRDVTTVNCVPVAARFSDGTIWHNQ